MSYNSNDTYGVFVVLECYLGAVRAVRVPGPGDQAYRVPGQQSRVSVQHSQAHLTAGAVTYIRNCMKYFWFRSPTQLLIQGQWWSILLTQCLQILQWWARGGRYISHLGQNCTVLYSTAVQYRPGTDGPVLPGGDTPSLAVGVGEVNPAVDGRSVEHRKPH